MKADASSVALCQNESKNCRLHLVYIGSGGATLLVGTWQHEKTRIK